MKLFVNYATNNLPFAKAWYTEKYEGLSHLLDFDINKGCDLKYAAEMVEDLVDGLRTLDEYKQKLTCHEGKVNKLEFGSGRNWHVYVDGASYYECEKVILATGSHPRPFDGCSESSIVSLEDILQPDLVCQSISNSDTVAVLGSSHSAMLAVKILAELPNRPRKVINLYRSPLKFAEYISDDLIKHDNTGLKGDVADWVKINIRDTEGDQLDGFLERYSLAEDEEAVYKEWLPRCDKVVPAIGYIRNKLPEIIFNGKIVTDLDYSEKNQLVDNTNSLPLANLYGVGIAFPQRVRDVDGSPELAVGLAKFMRCVDLLSYRLFRD